MRLLSKLQSPFISMPIFSVLLVYVWLTLFAPVSGQPFDTNTSSDNLLPNSQIDEWENGKPVQWDIKSSDPEAIQYNIAETIGYVNGSALYVDVPKNERGTVRISTSAIDVDANTDYFFKSFYKTDTSLSILAEYFNIDGSKSTELVKQLPDYDYDWSSMSGRISTGPEVKSLKIHIIVAEKGYIELDAAYLVRESGADVVESKTNLIESDTWEPFQTGIVAVEYSESLGEMNTRISELAIGQAGWVPTQVSVQGFEQYETTFTYQSNETIGLWVDYTRTDGSGFYRELQRLNPSPLPTTVTVPIEIPFDAVTAQPSLQLNHVGEFSFKNMQLFKTAESKSFKESKISITFDDGWETSYTNGARILDQHGFVGTYYINPGYIDTPEYMTKEDLQSLLDSGHQIGSHTNFHIDLTSYTKETIRDDLKQQNKFISDLGIGEIDFASPFGKIDDAALPIVMENSLSHRGTEEGINTKHNYDTTNLKGLFIRQETTDDELREYIQRTIESNGWLILIYHRVETTDQFFDVDLATFERHMKIVADSAVEVQTVREAIESIE